MDQFHHLIHMIALKEKLFTADLALNNCQPRILDVGHGTGIWALDMGRCYPGFDIFGIDLIDNQARPRNPIRNVSFYNKVDFTKPNWPFSRLSFDLIRMSQLCGSVRNWLEQYRIVHGSVLR